MQRSLPLLISLMAAGPLVGCSGGGGEAKSASVESAGTSWGEHAWSTPQGDVLNVKLMRPPVGSRVSLLAELQITRDGQCQRFVESIPAPASRTTAYDGTFWTIVQPTTPAQTCVPTVAVPSPLDKRIFNETVNGRNDLLNSNSLSVADAHVFDRVPELSPTTVLGSRSVLLNRNFDLGVIADLETKSLAAVAIRASWFDDDRSDQSFRPEDEGRLEAVLIHRDAHDERLRAERKRFQCLYVPAYRRLSNEYSDKGTVIPYAVTDAVIRDSIAGLSESKGSCE